MIRAMIPPNSRIVATRNAQIKAITMLATTRLTEALTRSMDTDLSVVVFLKYSGSSRLLMNFTTLAGSTFPKKPPTERATLPRDLASMDDSHRSTASATFKVTALEPTAEIRKLTESLET